MSNNLLDGISIASPCSADWNQMQGDDRRRFCGSCKLHVHNLSAMTTAEARTVLQDAGQGRVCVRFFRRADGTVLTRDCPVGRRQRMRRAWSRAAALWMALWMALWTGSACTRETAPVPASPSVPSVPAVSPQTEPLQGKCEMGDVAAPVPAPTPPPAPTELLGRVRSTPVEPKE